MESEDYEYFSAPRPQPASSPGGGQRRISAPEVPKVNRMFGDSQQASPVSTLSRSNQSLSSLYQARKANDSATVLQIKEQFQKQIEQMLQSSQRHDSGRVSSAPNNAFPPPPKLSSPSRLPGLQLDPPPEFGGFEKPRLTEENPRRWGLADFSVPAVAGAGKLAGGGSSRPWSQAETHHTGAGFRKLSSETFRNSNSNSRNDAILPHGISPVDRFTPSPDKSTGIEPQRSRPIINISPRNGEKEVNFRNLQRGKSFLEARSAVQRQIEKMFVEANEDMKASHPHGNIKHTMHGVSHVRPDEEDQYHTPPPVHYGVEDAIKARRESPLGPRDGSEAKSIVSNGVRLASFSPILSDSDKSKTENFNSRSTIAERSIDRKDKFMSLDSLASTSTGASTFVDLGNIDVQKSDRRMSADVESLAAQVRRRERSREQDENIRRISVHQDSFDFNTATDEPVSSMASPVGTLESRVSVTSRYTSSVSIQKSKPVKYKIEYLGAVPIRSKATNLDSLQVPLKELYFKHKALLSLGHSNLPGTLEISDTGLKVQYIRELHKGVQELFNSFPTIAVWAAVKFTHKTIILPSSERRQKFAFVPLISDSQNEEKRRVFYDLDYDEINLAQKGPHPPVFACVMRRSGQPKQLECHGFICASSEDAIIIAANLYQALVDTMKRHKAAGHSKGDPHSPRSIQRNEFNRRSSRRSVRKGGEPPVRPPRKRRTRGDEPRVVTGLVRRRSIRSSTRSIKSNRSNRSTRSGRRRAAESSARRGQVKTVQIQREEFSRQSSKRFKSVGGDAVKNGRPEGDLFTKVSIGRTKSFVKTGNQYNLQELFRELKEKEGVESIDDVLKRVISPNGMSFNDIKPVYRELLLKLAMTMSQDEIFERSKSIMASNKKGIKKSKDNENTGSLGSFFKSFSRPNSKSNSLASKRSPEKTKVDVHVSKPAKSNKASRGKTLTKADISGPLPILGEPVKPAPGLLKERKKEKEEQTDDAYVSCSECAYESVCGYDSCACRKKRPTRQLTQDMKHLSSGSNSSGGSSRVNETEVPSECDADSCISSEKCYCSLRGDPRTNKPGLDSSVYSEITADSGTVTDTSCYSTTCYTSHSRTNHSHASSSSSPSPLSASHSPLTAWKRNMMNDKIVRLNSTCCSCSEYSDTGGHQTNSLKFNRNLPPIPPPATGAGSAGVDADGSMRRQNSGGSGYQSNDSYSHPPQWRGNSPRRNVTDGRGSEGSSSCSSSSNRSSASPSNTSIRSSNSSHPKVLVLSAVDPRGNVVYRGTSTQPTKVTRTQSQDEQNILSMKKTAEIAALFSGAKINQTTDLVDRSGAESDSCSCSRTSFKSSGSSNHPGIHLGYYP